MTLITKSIYLTGNTRVLISRGCKPPDILQSNLMTSTGASGDTTKTYIQFCLTELCNVGDGRKALHYVTLINFSNLIIFYLKD